MPDKTTTLKLIDNTDVFPNIKEENIPSGSISYEKLNEVLKDHYGKTILDDHSNVTTIDTQLRNANEAKADTIYTISGFDNTGYTNYPDGAIDGTRNLLITLKSAYHSGFLYDQYFINTRGVYHRGKNGDEGSWSEWELRNGRIFLVSDGNATTLVNTINKAVKINGSTVFIYGTYDLNSIGLNSDIQLGNDIKLIGSSRSLITYYYSGSDDNIRKNVSPFHKLYNGGGFTMENITIKCKNVRYCVHDDDSGADDIYHNYYRNCFFELDNTENPVDGTPLTIQTIGGGLGTNGHIVIENSRFFSHAHKNVALAETIDVSYHNSGQSYGKSHITVTGCYFANTFRAGWWGKTTEMTEVLLSNNSFAIPPICRPENTEENAQTENMRLISFNNIIRENDDVGLFTRIYKIHDVYFHPVSELINLMEEGKQYMLIPVTSGKVMIDTGAIIGFSGNPVMIWKNNGNIYTIASFVDIHGKMMTPSGAENPIQITQFAYCNLYRVN